MWSPFVVLVVLYSPPTHAFPSGVPPDHPPPTHPLPLLTHGLKSRADIFSYRFFSLKQRKSLEAFFDVFGEEPGYGRIARVVIDELVKRVGYHRWPTASIRYAMLVSLFFVDFEDAVCECAFRATVTLATTILRPLFIKALCFHYVNGGFWKSCFDMKRRVVTNITLFISFFFCYLFFFL